MRVAFLLLDVEEALGARPPDLFTAMSGCGESLCFSAMPLISRAI